jgi:calmodulin
MPQELTEEEKIDLRVAFDMFDTDGGGEYLNIMFHMFYSTIFNPRDTEKNNCSYMWHVHQIICNSLIGSIDHEELKAVMLRFGQKLSDSEIRDMIRSVDIDNNNEIDFDEFLTLMKSRISRDPDYELRLAFDMIDADSSGTICMNELRSLMKKCNQMLSDEEINAIMSEFDVDGNGELDFEEFKQLMVSKIFI